LLPYRLCPRFLTISKSNKAGYNVFRKEEKFNVETTMLTKKQENEGAKRKTCCCKNHVNEEATK